MATLKVTSVKEAVDLMATEAASRGGNASDTNGVVRALVAESLQGRANVHFEAWLLVCCELADRAARLEGYSNQADRAYALASAKCAEPTLDYSDGGKLQCGVCKGTCYQHYNDGTRNDLGECCKGKGRI